MSDYSDIEVNICGVLFLFALLGKGNQSIVGQCSREATRKTQADAIETMKMPPTWRSSL